MIEAVAGRVDFAAELAKLAHLKINYDEADAPGPGNPGDWHVDESSAFIATEPSGPPVRGGPWDIACTLVREYEFADPRIIRAVYRPDSELLGRDMLLEARFAGLRFYVGVRVTQVVDGYRDGKRAWGWAYQTLEGHLEQGRLLYEVTKDEQSGEVQLVLSAYSRRAPIANPVIRAGFEIFGRRLQLYFYAQVGRRLRSAVETVLAGGEAPQPILTSEGLIMAPSGIRRNPLERLAIKAHHSGG